VLYIGSVWQLNYPKRLSLICTG